MIIDNNFILNDENLSYLELLGNIDIDSLKKFKDIYNLDNLKINEIKKIFKGNSFLFLNNKNEFANLFSLLLDKIEYNIIEIQNNKIINKNNRLYIYDNDLLIKETNEKGFVFKEYFYDENDLLILTTDHVGTHTKFEYNKNNEVILRKQITNRYIEEMITDYNENTIIINNYKISNDSLVESYKYYFDVNRNVIKEEFNDFDMINYSYIKEFKYDLNNNLLEYFCKTNDNSTYLIKYDYQNNLLMNSRIKKNDEIFQYTQEYEYNENNQLTKIIDLEQNREINYNPITKEIRFSNIQTFEKNLDDYLDDYLNYDLNK